MNRFRYYRWFHSRFHPHHHRRQPGTGHTSATNNKVLSQCNDATMQRKLRKAFDLSRLKKSSVFVPIGDNRETLILVDFFLRFESWRLSPMGRLSNYEDDTRICYEGF
jgi:hypothetical protein